MKRQPINKDNYEEFFLLYVDNELTAEEKKAVDRFIEMNPGLNMELQMFLDTKLSMEDIKMDGLETLYRHEDGLIATDNNEEKVIGRDTKVESITPDNYEEFQVLLLDNEINNDQKKAVELYNSSHAEAAINFEWLKKSKLPEEHVAFPDKKSLYRHEQKPATILSFHWVRYAAAAAVLIVAGLLWISKDNEELGAGIYQPIAEAQTAEDTKKTDSGETGTLPGNIVESENTGGKEKDTNDKEQTNETILALVDGRLTTDSKQVDEKIKSAPGKERKDPPVIEQDAPKNVDIDSRSKQQLIAIEKNETKIRTEDLVSQQTTNSVQQGKESMTGPAPFAQPAVAMNVKTNYASDALNGEIDDEDVVSIQDEPKQRKGLRGIVRKANRIYNKVTNPDMDKPLVKVANLEIGLQR